MRWIKVSYQKLRWKERKNVGFAWRWIPRLFCLAATILCAWNVTETGKQTCMSCPLFALVDWFMLLVLIWGNLCLVIFKSNVGCLVSCWKPYLRRICRMNLIARYLDNSFTTEHVSQHTVVNEPWTNRFCSLYSYEVIYPKCVSSRKNC